MRNRPSRSASPASSRSRVRSTRARAATESPRAARFRKRELGNNNEFSDGDEQETSNRKRSGPKKTTHQNSLKSKDRSLLASIKGNLSKENTKHKEKTAPSKKKSKQIDSSDDESDMECSSGARSTRSSRMTNLKKDKRDKPNPRRNLRGQKSSKDDSSEEEEIKDDTRRNNLATRLSRRKPSKEEESSDEEEMETRQTSRRDTRQSSCRRQSSTEVLAQRDDTSRKNAQAAQQSSKRGQYKEKSVLSSSVEEESEDEEIKDISSRENSNSTGKTPTLVDDSSSDEIEEIAVRNSSKKKLGGKVVDITESSGGETSVEEISSDDDDDKSEGEVISDDSGEETLEELYNHISELQIEITSLKDHHAKQLKPKDEEIERLKNELTWKDEQMAEMNDLISKNMELESKISAMLGDKENYENEVKKVTEEREGREKKEKEENVRKEKGEKRGKKRKSTSEEGGKKKRRRSKRGKKEREEDESEEEDIDAMFVEESDNDDSDDIQILDPPSKDTARSEKDAIKSDEGKDSKIEKITIKSDDGTDSKIENSSVCAQENAKENKPTTKKTGEEKKEGNSEDDEDTEEKEGTGRHNIRKLMTGKKLTEQTKAAAKAEKERLERVKRQQEQHLIVQEDDPKTKMKICTKLVLAFKEGTKTPLVEVLPKVVKKLKPHQVEAVEFIWDNMIESMEKLKNKDPGQGCILAHCMGLGKTLSVITLIHTLLKSKAVEFKNCLVVCPLNTVLNWQYEWKKWFDKKDRITTYELASCKGNHERAEFLAKWHNSGGIMIMGYSLFRILATYSGKSKKCKKAFHEALLKPGPDLVVCDEGHVLKNDASALSKAMSQICTRRRVMLTGTPLQNNLTEYHCMTNFVKPNLLGTRKEFGNRFGNPITNGQHSDSTVRDVRLMKRRAHVLHEMLSGCVQRRDYSALTKFLPPKYEYVLSVRLSPLQIQLYEKYLDTFRSEEKEAANQTGAQFKIRGASLFTDYQQLMRVWTHPWVLKLDAIRQEKKAMCEQDDELDSLDDESESEIVISDSEDETTEMEGDTGTESEEEEREENNHNKNDSSDSEVVVNRSPRRTRAHGNVSEEDKKHKEEGTKPRSKKPSASKKEYVKKGNSKKRVRVESDNSKGSSSDSKASASRKKSLKKKQRGSGSENGKKVTENGTESESTDVCDDNTADGDLGIRKAKILAGEVIRKWKSTSRHGKQEELNLDELLRKDTQWWTDLVDEEKHKTLLELSGKLILMFEILRMSEGLGDKVLLFSQSILSLDLIEIFLKYKNEEADNWKGKKAEKRSSWVKDEDYLRMDGSTGAQNRSKFTASFNEVKNKKLRLFLISTRAGGLGINLETANRVIIFDASWNPSHDVQSIFRVYRFGQEKDVYVYRLLAQGTMEEKIYERQVTKETLAQRVIDEHQIDRHFTASDLKDLYVFKPDRLDDPDRKEPPTPAMPKDLILTELLSEQKDWIYGYHEHDSLLENHPEQNLSEDEKKAAWDDYERDKQGLFSYNTYHHQPAAINFPNTTQYTQRAPLFTQYLAGPHQQNMYRPSVGTMASAHLTRMVSNMPQSNYPQVNVQIAQLPRVVQEILKYNPTISADELQNRLQSFLGMHSRYTNVSQGPQPPPLSITITPGTSSSSTTNSSVINLALPGLPASGVASSLPPLMATNFPNPMPSRLPTTGTLPAFSKK